MEGRVVGGEVRTIGRRECKALSYLLVIRVRGWYGCHV